MAKIHTNTQKPFNYRLLAFILACCFGIFFSIPSFFQDSSKYPFFDGYKKITLGLDLQGGLSLLLDVDVNEAVGNKYSSMLSDLKHQTDKKNIFINKLRMQGDSISFILLDSSRTKDMESILSNMEGVAWSQSGNTFNIALNEEAIKKVQKNALDQAIFTIRNRLSGFGLTEPNVLREGINQIRVEMPGAQSEEEQKRLIKLISQNAQLEFMAVDEDLARRMMNGEVISDEEAMRYNSVLLPYAENEMAKLPLKAVPILDGSSIVKADSTIDENKNDAVSFVLDSKGAEIFGDFTGRNIKKRLAIVLDKRIISAPSINQRIGGGNGIITGSFDRKAASDLAIALRSGALLAPVSVIEKRVVGPSLGADSIQASVIALISGFILVVGFMIVYYAMAGVFASLALVINLFLIIAVMALFDATLTLPGMAGIVLTVGMAVDANIIINERIREGLKSGMGVIKSLRIGYENASRAIFDANITSLIASVLLYVYGTGVIKGFAITTGIGILASIVTAIIGTHGIYLWLGNRIERSKNLAFWFGIKLDSKTEVAAKQKR
ncbi:MULTISPECIES: protein translocase subunit SecD [Helicobacter]|uniref:Protein translocase subunit SecD n=1 Tax=Helicobacter bilis ATCC 43879 TaxID=613026 RepID=C3XE91_9HELI|nr:MULTISPECIES: protein translocase subunit SecD [Helicobacter]EEO23330.1 protein-export membrane protein SecD [Helicobacter bilis ATCC 43879]